MTKLVKVIKGWFASEAAKRMAEKGNDLLAETESGLKGKYVDLPNTESAKNLSEAQAALIQALATVSEAVIVNEYVIVIKVTIKEKAMVRSFSLTERMRKKLDEMPELARDPQTAWRHFNRLGPGPRTALPSHGLAELSASSGPAAIGIGSDVDGSDSKA